MRKLLAIEGGWGAGKTTLLEGSKDIYNVLPSVVPQIYDILGRITNNGPDSTPEVFSELFYVLRSKELLKLSSENGQPILCDRTLFAPIVLRQFHNLPIPDKYFNTINFLRDKGLLHYKVFFVDQIPYKQYDNGWIKRRFDFSEADRYSKLTETLIKKMNFEIVRIIIDSKEARLNTFKKIVSDEINLINV